MDLRSHPRILIINNKKMRNVFLNKIHTCKVFNTIGLVRLSIFMDILVAGVFSFPLNYSQHCFGRVPSK